MIIDRRSALVSFTAAALGRVAWGEWVNPAAGASNSFVSSDHKDVEPGNGGSDHDLSLIGAHVYSEEGIPMFLGCENTAVTGLSSQTGGNGSDLNRKVSSAFEHYAQEWARLHPHAKASDAAKVLEFIAGRDFASGGLETSL